MLVHPIFFASACATVAAEATPTVAKEAVLIVAGQQAARPAVAVARQHAKNETARPPTPVAADQHRLQPLSRPTGCGTARSCFVHPTESSPARATLRPERCPGPQLPHSSRRSGRRAAPVDSCSDSGRPSAFGAVPGGVRRAPTACARPPRSRRAARRLRLTQSLDRPGSTQSARPGSKDRHTDTFQNIVGGGGRPGPSGGAAGVHVGRCAHEG